MNTDESRASYDKYCTYLVYIRSTEFVSHTSVGVPSDEANGTAPEDPIENLLDKKSSPVEKGFLQLLKNLRYLSLPVPSEPMLG